MPSPLASRLHRLSWPSPPELVLISDPGPDPDDVKAILIAGTLHRRGIVALKLVVANGGGEQVRARAKLARCLLDAIGASGVPVAVGSSGRSYQPVAHEYRLDGFDAVDEARLEPDGHAALCAVLRAARPKALTVVCISSLRDFADLVATHPALVLAKLERVAVQAGLEYDEAAARWVADTSTNNNFDVSAAQAVYDFCFGRGLPLTVVSRHAVPLLPMQLARSFATRTHSPVMRYLADAQFLGLEGLWQKLCEGKLPARCSKAWYFETFCGVGAEAFDAAGHERLDGTADIVPHLNGYIKPYDVVTLMSALPGAPSEPFARCARAELRLSPSAPAAAHALFLSAEHGIGAEPVIDTLRHVYHDVVLVTAPPLPVNRHLMDEPVRKNSRELNRSALPPATLEPAAERADTELGLGVPTSAPPGVSRQTLTGARHAARGMASTAKGRAPSARATHAPGDDVLEPEAIVALLDAALTDAHGRLQQVTRVAAVCSVLLFALAASLWGWAVFVPPPAEAGMAGRSSRQMVGVVSGTGLVLSMVLAALALQPIASHASATTALALVIAVGHVFLVISVLQLMLAQLRHEPGSIAFCGGAPTHAMYVANSARLCSAAVVTTGGLMFLGGTWARSHALDGARRQSMRLRALWAIVVVEFVLVATPTAVIIFARCVHEREAGVWQDAALLPVTAARAVVTLALCSALLAPHARTRAQALLAWTACARRDAVAVALAPLVGFGSAEAVEPARLVPEALRALHGVPLDSRLLRVLRLRHTPPAGHAAAVGGWRAWLPRVAGRRGDARVRARAAPALVAPFSAGDLDVVAAEVNERATDSATVSADSAHAATQRHSGRKLASAARGVLRRGFSLASRVATTRVDVVDRAQQPHAVDWLVVHSRADEPDARLRALRGWARAHAARTGAAPTVWLDELCADPILDARQQLAHETVAMCRARRLLCLVGPRFAEDVGCVGRLVAWRASGGAAADVDVLVVGASAEARRAVVSAIDAFHVMWTSASPGGAPEPRGGAGDASRALAHAIELMTVSRANAEVRALLPAVQRVVAEMGDEAESDSMQHQLSITAAAAAAEAHG